MMWGAGKGKEISEDFLRDWMHRLCSFASQVGEGFSVVEVDCQKLVSPEFAWTLRHEMREKLPGKSIINVFHLEDGEEGFRRLVGFSDYIAISVPELREAKGNKYSVYLRLLTREAKRLKPDIDIHMLGCTTISDLKDNRFCTSADSSSWSFFTRSTQKQYGYSQRLLKEEGLEKAKQDVKEALTKAGMEVKREISVSIAKQYLSASIFKQKYEQEVGRQ